MKISYLVTTHNEGHYVQELLDSIRYAVREAHDELIIVDDFSTDPETCDILEQAKKDGIPVYEHALGRDFATHKNFGNSKCTGDFIFQLDADELPPTELVRNIHYIVKENDVDLIHVPRINTVSGLTQEDIKRWGWKVNEQGWVMFPDYQGRIYRNAPGIRWYGNVHEQIIGFKTVSQLPAVEMWSIRHFKDIDRQRAQNRLYEEMGR
jgi:glycosyltransferase involved in cell wall biosynthesis